MFLAKESEVEIRVHARTNVNIIKIRTCELGETVSEKDQVDEALKKMPA